MGGIIWGEGVVDVSPQIFKMGVQNKMTFKNFRNIKMRGGR